MGNYSEALKEFSIAMERTDQNPIHNDLNYFIGVCKNNLGDFEGAIQNFNALLRIDPSNFPAKLKLGIALHNHKMWDKAVSLYKKILLANPHYADIHYNLGLSLLGKGRISEAITSFERAVQVNQGYLQARVKIVVAHIYLGNFNTAFEDLIPLAENNPGYADIQYYLGITYVARDEIENAIESFRRALDINPSYKDAKVKLGALYCYSGQFEEGIRELEGVSSLDPDDKAIIMAIKAMKSIPFSSCSSGEEVQKKCSKVFFGDRQIIQSLPEFNKSIEISPDISEMITFVMNVSEEDGSLYELLIPYVKEHAAEHDDYPDLHNSLGTLYMKVQRLDEAEVSFRRSLQLNPLYHKARINLFSVLKALEKYEDAIQEGECIQANNVTYPDFHCVMAEICESMADHKRALASISKSLEMNPGYSKAHFLAGKIYGTIGEKDKAVEHYVKCLNCSISIDLQELTKIELDKLI
jgi:tetratricopeptide (TPR) repeat protein